MRTNTMEKISDTSEISKGDYENLVNSFMKQTSYKPPNFVFDEGLKSRVEKRLQLHYVGPGRIAHIQPFIRAAVDMTCCVYPHLSLEIREAITLYTAYVISIDDMAIELSEDLQGYATTLMRGSHQADELLRGFTEFLSEQGVLFGAFGGSMIIKSTIDFISVGKVENDLDNTLRTPSDASDYLNFFRAKTGISEAYSFFLFPEDRYLESKELKRYFCAIPTLCHVYNYINDLLSFYKEEIQPGEPDNFVYSQAKFHSITALESLQRTQAFAVEVVQKLFRIFADEPDILRDMEKFVYGYIFYHLTSKRYRMAELNIPTAIEGSRLYSEAAKW
jgi:hypothetical protein